MKFFKYMFIFNCLFCSIAGANCGRTNYCVGDYVFHMPSNEYGYIVDSSRRGREFDIVLESTKRVLGESLNNLCITKFSHFNIQVGDVVYFKNFGRKAKVLCLHANESFSLEVEGKIIHGIRLKEIDVLKGELLGFRVGDKIFDRRWKGWAKIKRIDIAAKSFILEYIDGLYAGKQVYVWSGYPNRFD